MNKRLLDQLDTLLIAYEIDLDDYLALSKSGGTKQYVELQKDNIKKIKEKLNKLW